MTLAKLTIPNNLGFFLQNIKQRKVLFGFELGVKKIKGGSRDRTPSFLSAVALVLATLIYRSVTIYRLPEPISMRHVGPSHWSAGSCFKQHPSFIPSTGSQNPLPLNVFLGNTICVN